MTDLDAIVAGGGKPLADLLQFAIISAQAEPVFVALAREYQFRSTAAGAVALYDVFCTPAAPFRLRADERLPPRDLALAAAVAPVRAALDRAAAPRPEPPPGEDPPPPPVVPIPPRYLFDAVAEFVRADPTGPWATIAAGYDPDAGPFGNLPGRRMTPGQRVFVDTVWMRRVRPALVAAGFWRVASLGQP